MNDEEVVTMLRANRTLSPVELAELLHKATGGVLSQGSIVTYFKRAFPSIPLRVLLDSGAWVRVSNGDLSDEGFNELLGSWLANSTGGAVDER